MHPTALSWRLRGFLKRALDALATPSQHPNSVQAAGAARFRFCALAYEFDQAGLAKRFDRQASSDPIKFFADALLHLALQAWPYNRHASGMRVSVEVTAESKTAWYDLRDHLREFFGGDPEDASAVREKLRLICEAAINGESTPAVALAINPVATAQTGKPAKAAKSTQKKRRARRSHKAELLLAILDDRTKANLTMTELASELGVSVSSVSRAFRHPKLGPEIRRRYEDYGIKPPTAQQV